VEFLLVSPYYFVIVIGICLSVYLLHIRFALPIIICNPPIFIYGLDF